MKIVGQAFIFTAKLSFSFFLFFFVPFGNEARLIVRAQFAHTHTHTESI